MSEIYLMATICNRKNIPRFVKFYADAKAEVGNISLGMGTASSDVLDYFGLDDEEKGIHFGIVTADTWKQVKKGLQREFRIDVPGTGIVFTIPLSSIGGKRELGFLVTEQQFEKGDESELKETKHELIVAIANYGYNTQVMHAAEEGGATGGTVLHGKGVGMKRAKQFLGVSLVSEKEIILIVARTQQKNAIMKAIMEKAGVEIYPYDRFYEMLSSVAAQAAKEEQASGIWIDESRVNFRVLKELQKICVKAQSAQAGPVLLNRENPTTLMKSIKNETELLHTRRAHIKDAVAVTRFMYWLKKNIGSVPMDEVSVAEQIDGLRAQGLLN